MAKPIRSRKSISAAARPSSASNTPRGQATTCPQTFRIQYPLMRIPLFFLAASAAFAQQQPAPPVPYTLQPMYQLVNDYGNQHRYAADNQKLPAPATGEDRVVFMGDSITDAWGRGQFAQSAPFFSGKPYVNRGISGQVTAQMLLRFYPDVIALAPKAVLFLAGTNDIGGNIGP